MRTTAGRAAASAVLLLLLWLVPAATVAQAPDPSPAPVASTAPGPVEASPAPAELPAVPDGATLPSRSDAGPAAAPAGSGPQPSVDLNVVPGASRSLSVSIKLPTTDPGGSGVKGWYVSENPATPALGANGWKGIKPSTFTLSAGEGVRTVYAWAKTKSGVISGRSSDTVTLDQTAPTVVLTAPTDAAARTIAISLDAADPLSGGTEPAAGVTRWAVVSGTVAPGKDSTAWKTAAPTSFKLPAGNGLKTISAFVRDAAGNVSAASTTTVALAIAGPAVTITLPAATITRSTAVTLRATDPGGTGIAGYHLSENGSAPGPSATWALLPTTFTVSAGNGPKTVYAWAKDNNGTISARAEATTSLDTAKPTVELTAPASTTTIAIPITLSANDTGSGVAAYAVVNGTAVPAAASGAWQATPPTQKVLSLGNGTKTITAFVRDLAGNISAPVTVTVAMTLSAPTVTFSMPELTRTTTPSVTVGATDPGGTGIAGYYVSESPATPALTASGWAILPGSTTISSVQGIHTVYAWTKDKNGSISARQQTTTFLDSVKPAVSLTAPVATRPRDITVTISVTPDGGSAIVLWALVNGTTPPATGFPEWKATAPTTITLPAGDGSRTISAFARDAAGNVSLAASKVVIVDNVRPTATISAPAATAVRAIAVTVGGSDAASGVAAYALVEGTTEPAQGSGAWVASPPTGITLSDGDAHKTISAFTRDAAGNVSLAASTVVILDTTAPSVWLSTPTYHNGTTPWVALDGDDDGGSGITHWAVVAGTSQPAPGSAAWVTTKPSTVTVAAGDGPKVVSAWSRDAVGHVSPIHTRTITIDTVLPTVTLGDLPVRTNDRTIDVVLGGADDVSGVHRWAVSESATAPVPGSGGWRSTKPTDYTITGAEGTRTIRAWTRDAAGNVSLAAVQTTFLDAIAPSITFTTPAVTTVRTIALTISGSDAGSGITHWAVVEGTAEPAGGDPAWVASPATAWLLPAADGSTQLTVFSRDLAGNVGSVTRTVTLDTTAPTATLTAVTPGSSLTFAVTVGGSDGAAGSGISRYAVVEGTTAPAPGSAAWVATAPTTVLVGAGSDGSRTISAFTRDAAGHVSAAATTTVTLDTAQPSATLAALGPTRNRTITVVIGGTDDAGGVGITRYAVVEGTGAPVPGSASWVASPPTSFQVSVTDGLKTVSAFTRDAAGNVSPAATRTVLLDTSRPTVTLSAPVTTTTQLITVTITGTDGTGSGITAWAVTEGTLVPAADSTKWVASPPTSLTLSAGLGDKQVTAFSRDAAGNVSVGVTRTVTVQAP